MANTPSKTIDRLIQVRQDIGDCTRCGLHVGRINIVFGEGNPFANIMIIGEGPGEREDAMGRPFVGKSGELLDAGLSFAGLSRDDVYIANIVKCRPPNNRNPVTKEQDTCSTFLYKQIDIIKPKVIMTLGKIAAEYLLKKPVKITQSVGRVKFIELLENKIIVVINYHPAYLLRNQNPGLKGSFFDTIITALEYSHDTNRQTAYAIVRP